jgi:hypothetical protein
MRLSIVGSRLAALALLALAATLPWAGCGSNRPSVPQFKIHGKVLSHGQPAAGAIVVLHPLDKTVASLYPPRGVAGKDGAFVVGSRMTDDGAPEGEYAVTVVWPEERDAKKQFENTPPDRLANRYNDAKNAKWRIRVSHGENALPPLELD